VVVDANDLYKVSNFFLLRCLKFFELSTHEEF